MPSGLFEREGLVEGSPGAPPQDLLVTALATVVVDAAIAWLLRFLISHSTLGFVTYRVVLGAFVRDLVAVGATVAQRM